jgi:quinol monooxygenase YgiN
MNRVVVAVVLSLSFGSLSCGLPIPDDAKCMKGVLEADLGSEGMKGAGLVNGKVPAGRYVMSATYLKFKPTVATLNTFQTVLDPIEKALPTTEGLIAYELSGSSSCSTARTLAVWRDEASMYAFVASTAHANAMAKGSELSRGGSLTTHWVDTEAGATMGKAVQMLDSDQSSF